MKKNVYVLATMVAYLGGILLFVLSACNSKKVEGGDSITQLSLVEDVKVKSIHTSQFFSSVKCVVLDTDDNLLIDRTVQIKHKGNFFYAADSRTLYKFNENGNLIGKISKAGQGPGEYIDIYDFEIDDEESVWILSRNNRCLYKYNWEGELIKELKLNYWASEMFLISPGKMLLYIGNMMNKDNQHQVKIIDLETNNILANCLEINSKEAKYLHVMSGNHFAKGVDGTNYFYNIFDETIYAISDEGLSPIFHIDMYGKNIPPSFYDTEYEDVRDFFQNVFAGNYAYGTSLFAEGKDNFLYKYFYQGKPRMVLISKETKESVVDFEELIEDTILSGYTFDFGDRAIYGQTSNEIIIPLQPFEIMEYAATKPGMEERIKDAIKYIGEDQNPVLLILGI